MLDAIVNNEITPKNVKYILVTPDNQAVVDNEDTSTLLSFKSLKAAQKFCKAYPEFSWRPVRLKYEEVH